MKLAYLFLIAVVACAHARETIPRETVSREECALAFAHAMAVNMGDPEMCVEINPLPRDCDMKRSTYRCLMRAKTPVELARCP